MFSSCFVGEVPIVPGQLPHHKTSQGTAASSDAGSAAARGQGAPPGLGGKCCGKLRQFFVDSHGNIYGFLWFIMEIRSWFLK